MISLASVRRFISILLIGTYLLSSTPLVELLKIPDLIEHYSEHRRESGNLSFLEFIHQHYSDEHSGENQSDNHCNLPFKTHEQGNAISIYILAHISLDLPGSVLPSEDIYINPEKSIRVTGSLASIWQPPQLV